VSLALAASACGAGRLAKSNNQRVGRNGGGFQRRFELENRRSALTPSLARNMLNLCAPVHAYANDSGEHLHARAPVRACAPATRAHKLLLAICSQALSPGDLLSRPLSHATTATCARPWMLLRAIHAHSCMFAGAHIHDCTNATRAHPLFLALDPV
jgi:hypothetical protein